MTDPTMFRVSPVMTTSIRLRMQLCYIIIVIKTDKVKKFIKFLKKILTNKNNML